MRLAGLTLRVAFGNLSRLRSTVEVKSRVMAQADYFHHPNSESLLLNPDYYYIHAGQIFTWVFSLCSRLGRSCVDVRADSLRWSGFRAGI